MIDHPDQWFGGRTFAQHGDDLIILNIFVRMDIRSPSYLDIGAYHPFEISNTALLYQRGSRGINVEANPDLLAEFRRHRPEDINLNVGVAPQAGVLRFYRSSQTCGRNSFLRAMVVGIGISSEIDVPMTTVNEIVNTHANGKFPDLLTIDVEGMDAEILASIDFTRSAPKVICAEMVGQSEALRSLLSERGYFPCFRAGHNVIFVRDEYRDMMY